MGAVSEGAEGPLAAAFRDEWPRLIGATLRIVGDLQTAEDVNPAGRFGVATAAASWLKASEEKGSLLPTEACPAAGKRRQTARMKAAARGERRIGPTYARAHTGATGPSCRAGVG